MTAAPTTVFVTSNGESDGVGVALIKRFAGDGARVVVAGSDPVYGTVLMGEIASTGGDASFVLTDLDDLVSVGRAVDHAGRIDVLVNIADDFAPGAESRSVDDWYLKTFSSLLLTCAVVPGMRRRGRGTVITINTVAPTDPSADPRYAPAAKLRELTRRWSDAWAGRGVLVNSIAIEAGESDAALADNRTMLVDAALRFSQERSTVTGTTIGLPAVTAASSGRVSGERPLG